MHIDLLSRWENWLLVEKNKQASTIDGYKTDVRLFQEYILDVYNKEDFHLATPDEIRDFLKHCMDDRDNSRRTVGRKVSALRTFFHFATADGSISSNPMDSLEYETPRGRRLPRHLAKNEYDLLLKALTETSPEFAVRNRAMVGVMIASGLRVSELVNLDLSDVRLHGTQSTLRVIGKGDQERRVPIGSLGRRLLREYLDIRPRVNTNAIFISKRKQRISRHTVHWVIKQAAAHLEMDTDVSAHKLRHTFAMMAYEAGWDLLALQKALGHASPETTSIYAHASESYLIRKMQETDPF